MSARTHPRHHASAPAGGGHARAGSGGTGPREAGIRPWGGGTGPRTTCGPEQREAVRPWGAGTGLRWWALVLLVIAFSALFLLVTGAGRAQAATHSPVAFLGWIQLALTGP
ncbi:hypothetical protein [Streptomyces sp. WMMC940]|uniref:hypothetical protein n=1 Tax=Streptomyces sp. WMMC940 TaxID=3015153 RepID=UPI0022B70620|nr:hypothetical protein [Streptomyces sp. WMMC940]MCZ7461129.1 hypothetical protein [Streptomyces sp. WMMC940]